MPDGVDTAHAVLDIGTGAYVNRVLFDTTSFDKPRAIGVEFQMTRGGPFYEVHARKEVILCGGSINTPQTLMLSGIGQREELEKIGVAIVQENEHVGKHMKDHFCTSGIVCRAKPGYTLDYLTDDIKAIPSLVRWLITGGGPVTSNVADAPLPDDVRAIEKGSSVFFKLVMGDPGVTEVEDSEETDEEDHLAEDELLEEFRAADSALAAINHDASRGDQVAQQWHAFDNARRPMDDRALALSRARARAAARAVNARHNAKANKARLRAARRRARARAQKLQVTSRRVFHWDVAVRRNVIPIAIMSYVSMWILLVDGM